MTYYEIWKLADKKIDEYKSENIPVAAEVNRAVELLGELIEKHNLRRCNDIT